MPSHWPEDYAKVLTTFFYLIENHEDKGLDGGKDALLLYQARMRRAWHNELKSNHFFNLAIIDDKKLNFARKEVDAKHNAAIRKAVSHSQTFSLNFPLTSPLPPPPHRVHALPQPMTDTLL
jgi:hypothetical protein